MKKITKSKLFWGVAAAVALLCFFAGVNSSRVYEAETRVMFVFKSGAAAGNAERIVGDAREIFKSLNFYNELIADDIQFGDLADDLSSGARRKIWDDRSGFQKMKKSNLVKITIKSSNRQEAEEMSRESAKKIAVVMSRYYDIKSDLDIRIIDRITFQKWDAIPKWMAVGIFAGLFSGLLVYFIFLKSRQNAGKIGKQFEGRVKEIFAAVKQAKKEEETFTEEIHEAEMANFPKEKIIAAGSSRKAAAPDNLPIGDNFVLPVKKTKVAEKPEPRREATPEEVRERLNKLLRGEM